MGNSLGLRLPKSVALEAQLDEGDTVDGSVKDGAIVVRPTRPTVRSIPSPRRLRLATATARATSLANCKAAMASALRARSRQIQHLPYSLPISLTLQQRESPSTMCTLTKQRTHLHTPCTRHASPACLFQACAWRKEVAISF